MLLRVKYILRTHKWYNLIWKGLCIINKQNLHLSYMHTFSRFSPLNCRCFNSIVYSIFRGWTLTIRRT